MMAEAYGQKEALTSKISEKCVIETFRCNAAILPEESPWISQLADTAPTAATRMIASPGQLQLQSCTSPLAYR